MKLRTALPWLVLAVASIGLVVHSLQYSYVSDDAYISFRYSYNLAMHGEFTFNLGERVEGYTNFLWALLLAGFIKLGLRSEVMSQVFATAFGCANLILIYLLTRIYRGGKPTGWDLLGALLLPACATFAVWCTGGLEAQMFAALTTAGITLYIAEQAGKARLRFSGLLFALAAMTRPEGLLFFGLTGIHRLTTNLIQEHRIRPSRAEIFWLLGFVIPFGVYFLWRYSYYGYLFPNTFYVKAGGTGLLMAKKWGFIYLWDFIHQNRLYVLAPCLLFLFQRPKIEFANNELPVGVRPSFVWTYIAPITFCFAAYVVWVGGDFMTMSRFFVPLMPLLAFVAQESIRSLVEKFPRRGINEWRPLRMIPTAVILLGLCIWNSVGLHKDNKNLSYYRWGLDTVAYLKKFANDRILIGNWMRRHLPKDTYLAVGGAGAIVYASRFKALDAFGLNDEWIAHKAPRGGDRPGHSKFAPEHYVLEQKPDLICHIGKHQDSLYRPPGTEVSYWNKRGYSWVCLNPPGLNPRYYCCLKRKDRDLGPIPIPVGS
ncbi:MAG: hypothetical protein V1754_09090 [Pseudomonadota bacterium]